jgi:hypothetical protein
MRQACSHRDSAKSFRRTKLAGNAFLICQTLFISRKLPFCGGANVSCAACERRVSTLGAVNNSWMQVDISANAAALASLPLVGIFAA